MRTVTIAADLCFSVQVPGGPTVNGQVRGSGSDLVVEVDDPGLFAGRSDAPAIRALAEGLGRRGLRVRVHDREHHLLTLGAVRSSWWQRRLTGSRYMRLGSLRGAWTGARSRAGADRPVLPDATLAPPATLFPVAPTFLRRPPPQGHHHPRPAARRQPPPHPGAHRRRAHRQSAGVLPRRRHHDRLRRAVRRTPARPRRRARGGTPRRRRRDGAARQRPARRGCTASGCGSRSCAPGAGSSSGPGR